MSKKKPKPNIYKKGTEPKVGDLCWTVLSKDRPVPIIVPCVVEAVFSNNTLQVRAYEAERKLFYEYQLKELLLNLGSFSDIFETRGEAFLSIQKDIHDGTASNLGHTLDAVIRENKYKPITELLLVDLKDHCG